MRSLRLALLLVFAVCCAAPTPYSVERCPDLRRLPPRPDDVCAADAESVAFQDRLTALLTSTAGRLALRVTLDANSRVASVCAEGTARGMEGARSRRLVSANLGDVYALAPGPACLANRRIDLDRRQALLVQIDRTEVQCRGEMRSSGGALVVGDQGYNPSAARGDATALERRLSPNACIGARIAWLFAEQRGSLWTFSARGRSNDPGVLLFSPIEDAQPPAAPARLAAQLCEKQTTREALLACMHRQRWELLD